MNEPARITDYQKDATDYVRVVARLFGGYKRRALEYLSVCEGQAVLDVGCGAGHDLLALAPAVGAAGRLCGIDQDPRMVAAAGDLAAKAGVRLELTAGAASHLPYDDNTFDRCRADRVFQHLRDPEQTLAEMIRVTRPSGYVCLVDIDWDTLVVDSDDPDTSRIIASLPGSITPNPRAGRTLYALLRKQALLEVDVFADAVALTDWNIACKLWSLHEFAQVAVSRGLLSPADASRWLAEMESRHASGRFLASITGFCARGKKA